MLPALPPMYKSLLILCLLFSPWLRLRAQSIQTNLVLTSFPQSSREGVRVSAGSLTLHLEGDILVSPGEHLRIRGKLYPHSSSLYAADFIRIRPAPALSVFFSRFRLDQERKILKIYSKESSALVLALGFGNKQFLSPRFLEYVKSSGMSHFFALSGLHLAMAAGGAFLLFSTLGLGKAHALAASLPFSTFYMLLGGGAVPLQRAFLFHVFWTIGALLRWNFSLLWVCGLSFVILLCLGAWGPSFLLSFSALGGIIFFRGFWEEALFRRFGAYFGGIISTSLAAGLATLPLSIYYFGEFNLFFLLPNLLILPLAPLLVGLCLGAALLPAPFWDMPLQLFYRMLSSFCAFTAKIPCSLVFFQNKAVAALFLVLSFSLLCIMIKSLAYGRIRHALRPFTTRRDF